MPFDAYAPTLCYILGCSPTFSLTSLAFGNCYLAIACTIVAALPAGPVMYSFFNYVLILFMVQLTNPPKLGNFHTARTSRDNSQRRAFFRSIDLILFSPGFRIVPIIEDLSNTHSWHSRTLSSPLSSLVYLPWICDACTACIFAAWPVKLEPNLPHS